MSKCKYHYSISARVKAGVFHKDGLISCEHPVQDDADYEELRKAICDDANVGEEFAVLRNISLLTGKSDDGKHIYHYHIVHLQDGEETLTHHDGIIISENRIKNGDDMQLVRETIAGIYKLPAAGIIIRAFNKLN